MSGSRCRQSNTASSIVLVSPVFNENNHLAMCCLVDHKSCPLAGPALERFHQIAGHWPAGHQTAGQENQQLVLLQVHTLA